MGTLRLILACAVVLVHSGGLFRFNITGGGQVPVELFYVISGFYMALVLNEKYVGAGSNRDFYYHRALRLLPTYWALALMALAIYLVIFLSTNGGYIASVKEGIYHEPSWKLMFLLVSNATLVGIDWLTRIFSIAPPNTVVLNAPAWTLGVEISFYAIAPFILRSRAACLVPLLIASVLLRASYFVGLEAGVDPWSYTFFPYEIALFLAGSLSYRIYTHIKDGQSGRALGYSLIGAVLLFQAIQKAITLSICNCDATVVPLRYALYAYAAIAIPFLFRETKNIKFDRHIGELSYPIYLAHYPLIDLYNFSFDPSSNLEQVAIRSSAVLISSVLLAFFVTRITTHWDDRTTASRVKG